MRQSTVDIAGINSKMRLFNRVALLAPVERRSYSTEFLLMKSEIFSRKGKIT
jgi:hypothetical protein